MPDSDNTTPIQINLDPKTTQELDATKGAVTETTAAVGDLSKATSQLAVETKAATAATEEFKLSHRDTKELIEVIGKIFPKVGEALGNFFKGRIGELALVAQLYELEKGQIDAMNAESDARGALNAQPEGAGIAGVQQAKDDAAEAKGKFYANLFTAQYDNDPIGTEIKRLKERTTESSALEQEKIERDAQSVPLRTKAAAAIDNEGRAEAKHMEFTAALNKARQATTPGTEEYNALKKRAEDADAKLRAAQAEPDAVTYGYAPSPPGDNGEEKRRHVAAAQAEVDKVNSEIDERQKQVADGQTNQLAQDFQYELAQKLSQDAQDASNHNADRLRQLPGEIQDALQHEATHQSGSAQPCPANSGTGPAGNTPSAASPGTNSSNVPPGLNAPDPCIDRLNTLLLAISANQQAMLGMMNSFIDGQSVIAEEIQSLNDKYKLVRDQIREVQTFGIH